MLCPFQHVESMNLNFLGLTHPSGQHKAFLFFLILGKLKWMIITEKTSVHKFAPPRNPEPVTSRRVQSTAGLETLVPGQNVIHVLKNK